MARILLVCTGNICRSPMAEGILRHVLSAVPGAGQVDVASAGTHGWEGSPAMPEAVEAARERSVDISRHLARKLAPRDLEEADLVVCLAGEHRDAVSRLDPEAAPKTFALKELVRLLEALPPGPADETLAERIARADGLRRTGFAGRPHNEDVTDPLGMGIDAFRAVAWDVGEWSDRLAAGLYPSGQPAAAEG